MIVGIILYVAIIVLMIASMWKIYAKAGQPGWACLVPIYNLIVLLQIIRKPVWWIVLLLIPIVNIIMLFIINLELAKVFGKGAGFGLGLIFLGFIFLPMLAFGDAAYVEGDNRSEKEILRDIDSKMPDSDAGAATAE